MNSPVRLIMTGAAVLMLLAGPAASENNTADMTCKQKTSAKGAPHRLRTIAQLNAVRAWVERSKSHGDAYAQWHNVRGGSIKCERPARSNYYSCTAAGRPCLPPAKTL